MTELREAVVRTARAMLARGLVTSTVGNVSARLQDGMLITPTRHHPDDLDAASLAEVEFCGDGLAHHHRLGPAPSLEWRMHAALYRARPDVHAVVHTHSPYAVARSFRSDALVVATEERAYLGLDRIDVAPAAPGGSVELALEVVRTIGPRAAVLLARHGVVAVGPDPRSALEMCCTVEHQAQIEHLRLAAPAHSGAVAANGRSRGPLGIA